MLGLKLNHVSKRAHWWHSLMTLVSVHTGSGNDLLPNGTKPLPEPMLKWHQLNGNLWYSPESNFTGFAQDINQAFTFLKSLLLTTWPKMWTDTGDPLHSRAACTQPCNVNTHSRAHCSPGARLCEQWGHGCVNNGARLCASARLCRGSPVTDDKWKYLDFQSNYF